MKRPHAVALLSWLGLLPGACADSTSEQLYIIHNQAPAGGQCLISAEASSVYIGEGILDVSLVSDSTPFAYRLHPLIQNDLPALGGAGAAEPNLVVLRGFRVTLELGDAPEEVARLFSRLANDSGGRALLSFEEPWSGTLAPGGSRAASVTTIPGELARQIRATGALEKVSHMTLFSRVQVLGERRGTTVLSRDFLYPTKVCNGCLVSTLRACPIKPVNLGNPCNLAQDVPVDCCVDLDSLRCGSAAGTADVGPGTSPPGTSPPSATP